MAEKIKALSGKYLWIWAVLGSAVLWIALGIVSGRPNFDSLFANAYTAAFLSVCALGQMLVITSGRGAIDLSIPGVLTLTAFVSMEIIGGENRNLTYAVFAVLMIGIVIGLINSFLVIFLKIPAIIATMAMNYILTTVSLLYNKGFSVFKVSPFLTALTRTKLAGTLHILIILILILGYFIHRLIFQTAYGKELIAVGQNITAAYFAGIRTRAVEIITYVFCSVLAAFAGMLISARVGGAFMGMGDSYTMETIGACVVGGTLISGGRASVFGTMAGCLFLSLIVTALQVGGASVGLQNIVKGFLIILVLMIGSGKKEA